VHAEGVTARRLGAHRHGAVEPGADLDRAAARDVAREVGRDLDREAELARAHAAVEVGIVEQRGALDEIA
jgi:hypothetical protein